MPYREGRSAIYRLATASLLNGIGTSIGGTTVPISICEATDHSRDLVVPRVPLLVRPQGDAGAVCRQARRPIRPQRVAIASSLAAASCCSVLAFADSPVELIAIGFIASVASIPVGAALGAAIPNMVSENELEWANGEGTRRVRPVVPHCSRRTIAQTIHLPR